MIRPDAFMLSGSFQQADYTARIDWGWERCGQGVWRRPDGAVVRYVGCPDNLHGLPRKTVVFLGHRWADRPRVEIEEIRVHSTRLKMTSDPNEPIERAGGGIDHV